MPKPTLKQAPDGTLYIDESRIQQAAVRWFRIVHARAGKYLFSIPNGGKAGGKRTKTGFPIQAARMVAEGLTAGVADLLLALPRCGLHGLFLETKTPVGRWEPDQQEFAERQLAEGYGYALYDSLNDFETIVGAYLGGTYVQEYELPQIAATAANGKTAAGKNRKIQPGRPN